MPAPAGYSQHYSGYWFKLSDQSGPYTFDGTTMVLVPIGGALPAGANTIGTVALASPAPIITAASGNVANAAAVATLAAVAAKTTYITGFEVTAGGATAAALVSVTIAGLSGGTATFTFATPAGATLAATPLVVTFNPPLPGSAVNTAVVVTLPALGAGNTNAAAVAHGYQL